MRRMSEEPTRPAVHPRRVSRQVQRAVTQRILDEGLRPGELLPTEAELTASLGVSRNSVREALKALQALDIVEIRHGHGTYVGQASLTPLADGLTFRTLLRPGDDAHALAEILQVREILEEGLVRRIAAAPPDAETLDRLDALVRRMSEAGEAGEPFADLDRAFHETLCRSLGNELIPQLLGAFWNVFDRVAGARRWAGDPAPEVTVERHRAIVTALRAGDAAAAQQAMATHFRGIEKRAERRTRGVH
ncbi:FCD domain-containing protein [Streptomyces sp. NPDC046939]|uniref:FadR/GntR family transcriptional regulator n=1 Tax=Streptomyces sp. NPDC046939 TaxID=3155376 RepID=UPI0033E51F2A